MPLLYYNSGDSNSHSIIDLIFILFSLIIILFDSVYESKSKLLHFSLSDDAISADVSRLNVLGFSMSYATCINNTGKLLSHNKISVFWLFL